MEKSDFKPKFYILSKINNHEEIKGSGGVVRLSISPSQGDDPGFKSRPEHPYPAYRNIINSRKDKEKVSQICLIGTSFCLTINIFNMQFRKLIKNKKYGKI